MADSLKCHDAKFALKDIQRRLKGFELDPFAAWMSQVFLDMTLDDLCHEAGMRISQVLRVCDSLKQHEMGEGFHLVVGNPPYGRTKLSPELRRRFRGSLFGHANLYGVFTHLALRFAREDGVVAYVTPTSFLAGEYFKALRGMLGRVAPRSALSSSPSAKAFSPTFCRRHCLQPTDAVPPRSQDRPTFCPMGMTARLPGRRQGRSSCRRTRANLG